MTVTGEVMASNQAPGGAEIAEPTLTPLSEPASPPPFDLYRPTVTAALPTVLDHAPTTPAASNAAPLACTSRRRARPASGPRSTRRASPRSIRPRSSRSATESGANVFAIDYFGQPAYLAQSPQFYKQAMVGVFERVYEVGPVFRAEPHDTARHLAQYTSLDAEFGFITDHYDVMAMLRDVFAGMVAGVADRAGQAVDLLSVKLPEVPTQIPELRLHCRPGTDGQPGGLGPARRA